MRRFIAARLMAVAATGAMAVACSSSPAPSALTQIPTAPVPAPWHQGAASASFSRHMLHASDFGAGWYEDFTPPVPKVTSLPPGAVAGAVTMLSKAYRTASGWVSDVQLTERAIEFGAVSRASNYVRAWMTYSNASANGIPVTITPGRRGGFVVARRAYILTALFFAHPAPNLSADMTNLRGAKRLYALARRKATRSS